MDAASAAAMSDPERNPHFRRRWSEMDDIVVPRPLPSADADQSLDGAALLQAWRRERAQAGRSVA